jgi:uncharacterized protein (TIGR00369 family)
MRNLDRWLGDGGMPLLEQLGATITAYGSTWAEASWTPTEMTCNPTGTVQAGVQSVVLDALMSFAALAGLESGERAATLELKVSTMKPVRAGVPLRARGEVLRLGHRIAYLQAFLRTPDDDLLTHATGTFALFRRDTAAG